MEQRQTILIIDDTPINIRVLSELLSDEYKVIFATNGQDCLAMARSERPDLILLDVMMPGMDGYEVCRRLKAEATTRDIPVIFVTALVSEADEARGLKAGAIDYITKPISPIIVKMRIRNHLELKRHRDLLADMAAIDGLTGIPNRRRFDEVLHMEWHRAQRTGKPLSLLMIDIDHFKRYNDSYGHLQGDDCLRDVARAFAELVHRGGDFVARYGGEEFVCVLAETDAQGAQIVAERLLAAVSDLNIPHETSPVAPRVTVSIGYCTASSVSGHSWEQLIDCADRNLYRAKQAGRNRVHICNLENCTLSCYETEQTV